ncbi:uncharacterized protein E0L32_009351 [Thyridium curvatum]|uniref:uracil phosphoribosyltransferase n=1 Tax=Thyridium curvatum TaxID=1093900 RepID=A0A507ANY9_9PEZI|nr:uncharacterized protein E0L32_009351 [Thyridium curvatum]TPX09463.1 hypothetical protein E0L32_009351 [Thyridium curvatum]
MATDIPKNVHVSAHPCLLAKLSQLRSNKTSPKEVKSLINDISLILGCEALAASVTSVPGAQDVTPIGFEYTSSGIEPSNMCLVPILRSGLGMVEAIQTLLPSPVPVHHLGLYREPTTLEPVEYYNNLPNHLTDPAAASAQEPPARIAFILDPVIATGGTCAAAIQTLREWGAHKVVVLSVAGAVAGVKRAAAEWPEGVEIFIAGIDPELTNEGMLRPGLGDVGDRLFLTIGK